VARPSSNFRDALQRGLTMSPRIQVYKAIACRMLRNTSNGSNGDFLVPCDDATVQARAAKIQACGWDIIMTLSPSDSPSAVVTTMSILSALSTGFWSRLGDTRGRKLILSTFLIGALSMSVGSLFLKFVPAY
jgi:MFS family permease